MSLEVVNQGDRKNSLLNRREVKLLLKNSAGTLTKNEAAELVSKQLGIDKKRVIPISLICETGKTDLHGLFYIYENEEEAMKNLPRYLILRNMPKADRKKLLDEEKAARLKAKQAAAAEAKSRSGGKR